MNHKEAIKLCDSLLPLKSWALVTKHQPHALDPASVWIDRRAQVSPEAVLIGNVEIRGEKSIIGPRVVIEHSVIDNSQLDSGVEVGPFNIIRRCSIGSRTKIPYQSEIADAMIGADNNIARDATFSNFDGVEKRATVMGDGCFVGTSVNINGGMEIRHEVRISPNLFIASPEPIKSHSWVVPCKHQGEHYFDELPNRSFKIPPHWVWLWTCEPMPDPEAMETLLFLLGTAFANTKDLVPFLKEKRPMLDNISFLDLLKRHRLNLTGEVRFQKFRNAVNGIIPEVK